MIDLLRTSSSVFASAAAAAATSEIIGRTFTKFVHDVAGLLLFNHLKAVSRSLDMLSNATAKSKGRSWQCLRTSPPNLTGCHSNVPWVWPLKEYRDNHPHQYAYQTCKVGQDKSGIF